MNFSTFLKVLAIGICFLLALYCLGLLINKPGLFPAVIAIIGAIIVFYLTYGKNRIPEAFIVFLVFGFVAIYGLGKFSTVRAFFSPKTVEAASSETLAKNTPTPEPPCQYQDRYPDQIVGWCKLIESAATEYSVDPILVAAVMMQESGGQPEVISESGAVGLMQVMPSDGIAAGFQCANGPCFASRPTIAQLKDPAFNVDYGVRMLAGLIERYGDEREALKAYGPYNVGYYYADKVLAIRGNP